MAQFYFILVIILLLIDWIVSSLADILNINRSISEVPDEFKGYYDEDTLLRSHNYLYDKTKVKGVMKTLIVAVLIFFISEGGFGWLVSIVEGVFSSMILQGLLFIGIILAFNLLVSIPFSLYETFVIEARYGFNKTTSKTFVFDTLKGILLTFVIGFPIFALILWFFAKFEFAWFWVWVSLSLFQLFLAFIAPVVILPLFNKFTPLEEGELKERVNEYAEAEKFKVNGIFTIDGSKRSTKGNAYFSGFGNTKRIAFFDTLLEKHEVGELISILAHEVGHCKLGHVKKMILLSLPTSLIMFYLLSLFIGQPDLYAAFRVEGTPLYAGIIFFSFIYSPLNMLLGLVSKALSRKNEFQADNFAAKTTGDPESMITALKKLSADNLGQISPHPMKVFLEHSHPPVLERIKSLRRFSNNSG